ncbi:MAG: hypothetical protein MJE68_18330, partial [Proteobacteria bacterium]|nr:hypothetical protein [Pseudomonadota bacterium]
LSDAIKLVEAVVADIPGSPASDSLTKSLRYMRAGKVCIERAQLATGTTSSAVGPMEVPLPQTLPVSTAAKMAHKRAASTIGVAPPEKRSRETDEEFAKRKKEYKTRVQKAASRETKMGHNQCACGLFFPSSDALQNHLKNVHPDNKSWICSKCGATCKSKAKLWQHFRHHENRYNYYCDVKFDDPNDLDEDGKPKKKLCEQGADEESYIIFHREKVHKVGRAKIRCTYCDKAQISNCAWKDHEKVCPKGPAKSGEPTDFCELCDYSCRGAAGLRTHMQVDHPETVGLKTGKRWKCRLCNKSYKSRSGARQHKCPKKEYPEQGN